VGWNFAAHLMLEAGDAETALQWYTRGVEAVKASDRAEEDKLVWIGRYHHGRGRCLARLGKKTEAWAEVETVKKMIDDGGEKGTPFLPAWHFLAGYVKLEAGDHEAAVAHLKDAGPQHDPHRTQLMGLAYERLGDKENARRCYEEVVAKKRLTIDGAAAYAPARARLGALKATASAK
jgi:tetratricopeptide (TPR) repeat protein